MWQRTWRLKQMKGCPLRSEDWLTPDIPPQSQYLGATLLWELTFWSEKLMVEDAEVRGGQNWSETEWYLWCKSMPRDLQILATMERRRMQGSGSQVWGENPSQTPRWAHCSQLPNLLYKNGKSWLPKLCHATLEHFLRKSAALSWCYQ